MRTYYPIQCRFWQIFVEALEEFTNLSIQSKTSASTHEYSESNRVSNYAMLYIKLQGQIPRAQSCLGGDQRHQLVLVP